MSGWAPSPPSARASTRRGSAHGSRATRCWDAASAVAVSAVVTAVGVLSASPGLAGTIEAYASGAVDPRALIAATVTLDELPGILAGARPAGAGGGPKFHVVV
jgi:hypothetical protein